MFHKYHLLNQLQVFMRYKKITKTSFNIPLRGFIVEYSLNVKREKKEPNKQHKAKITIFEFLVFY